MNLLTIGVVQRRRELGLLRALGLTSRQVRRVVLLEAAHITITSLVFGLLLGTAYGWVAAQSLLGSVRIPPLWQSPTFVAPVLPWAAIGVATSRSPAVGWAERIRSRLLRRGSRMPSCVV